MQAIAWASSAGKTQKTQLAHLRHVAHGAIHNHACTSASQGGRGQQLTPQTGPGRTGGRTHEHLARVALIDRFKLELVWPLVYSVDVFPEQCLGSSDEHPLAAITREPRVGDLMAAPKTIEHVGDHGRVQRRAGPGVVVCRIGHAHRALLKLPLAYAALTRPPSVASGPSFPPTPSEWKALPEKSG